MGVALSIITQYTVIMGKKFSRNNYYNCKGMIIVSLVDSLKGHRLDAHVTRYILHLLYRLD